MNSYYKHYFEVLCSYFIVKAQEINQIWFDRNLCFNTLTSYDIVEFEERFHELGFRKMSVNITNKGTLVNDEVVYEDSYRCSLYFSPDILTVKEFEKELDCLIHTTGEAGLKYRDFINIKSIAILDEDFSDENALVNPYTHINLFNGQYIFDTKKHKLMTEYNIVKLEHMDYIRMKDKGFDFASAYPVMYMIDCDTYFPVGLIQNIGTEVPNFNYDLAFAGDFSARHFSTLLTYFRINSIDDNIKKHLILINTNDTYSLVDIEKYQQLGYRLYNKYSVFWDDFRRDRGLDEVC